MKIKGEDFLNADEEQKENLINMIVEFETHNSISKDCMVEVIRHQQEKIERLEKIKTLETIETLEKNHRQGTTWFDIIKELKGGNIDVSKIKASKIGWETEKEINND